MSEKMDNLTVNGLVSAEELLVKHGATFDAGLEVKGATTVKGTITVGDTTLSEADLIGLLKLLK